MEEQAFTEFLGFCESYLQKTPDLVKLMRKRYDDCSTSFKYSENFAEFMQITRAKIESDEARIFVHLRDFLGKLKTLKDGKCGKKRKQNFTDASDSDSSVPSPKFARTEFESTDSSDGEEIKIVSSENSVEGSSVSEGGRGDSITNDKSELNDPKNSSSKRFKIDRQQVRKLLLVNKKHVDSDGYSSDDRINGEVNKWSSDSKDTPCGSPAKQGSKVSGQTNGIIKSQADIESDSSSCIEIFDDSQQNGETSPSEKPGVLTQNGTTTSSESDSGLKSKVKPDQVSFSNVFEKFAASDSKSVSPSSKSGTSNSRSSKSGTSFSNVYKTFLGTSSDTDNQNTISEKPSINIDHSKDITEQSNQDTKPSNNQNTISTEEGNSSHSETCTTDKSEGRCSSEVTEMDTCEPRRLEPSSLVTLGSVQSGSCSVDTGASNEMISEKDSANTESKSTKGSRRQIQRLEKLLEDLRNKIEELKTKELSLDEMENEDSSYIMEEKYQQKFVKVWNKLCELKGSLSSTGRPVEKRFSYTGTRYPEINRKLEKFVNKNKVFPDYHDVRNVIAKVNSRCKIGLRGSAIDRMAREAFSDIGDMLQKRRLRDLVYTSQGHLNEEYRKESDPALRDTELKKKLEENRKVCKGKIEAILEKFCHKEDFCKMNKEGSDSNSEQNSEAETEDEVEVPEMDKIIQEETANEQVHLLEDVSPSMGPSQSSKSAQEPIKMKNETKTSSKTVIKHVDKNTMEDNEKPSGNIGTKCEKFSDDVVFVDSFNEKDEKQLLSSSTTEHNTTNTNGSTDKARDVAPCISLDDIMTDPEVEIVTDSLSDDSNSEHNWVIDRNNERPVTDSGKVSGTSPEEYVLSSAESNQDHKDEDLDMSCVAIEDEHSNENDNDSSTLVIANVRTMNSDSFEMFEGSYHDDDDDDDVVSVVCRSDKDDKKDDDNSDTKSECDGAGSAGTVQEIFEGSDGGNDDDVVTVISKSDKDDKKEEYNLDTKSEHHGAGTAVTVQEIFEGSDSGSDDDVVSVVCKSDKDDKKEDENSDTKSEHDSAGTAGTVQEIFEGSDCGVDDDVVSVVCKSDKDDKKEDNYLDTKSLHDGSGTAGTVQEICEGSDCGVDDDVVSVVCKSDNDDKKEDNNLDTKSLHDGSGTAGTVQEICEGSDARDDDDDAVITVICKSDKDDKDDNNLDTKSLRDGAGTAGTVQEIFEDSDGGISVLDKNEDENIPNVNTKAELDGSGESKNHSSTTHPTSRKFSSNHANSNSSVPSKLYFKRCVPSTSTPKVEKHVMKSFPNVSVINEETSDFSVISIDDSDDEEEDAKCEKNVKSPLSTHNSSTNGESDEECIILIDSD